MGEQILAELLVVLLLLLVMIMMLLLMNMVCTKELASQNFCLCNLSRVEPYVHNRLKLSASIFLFFYFIFYFIDTIVCIHIK
jgi:hypothetical protein